MKSESTEPGDPGLPKRRPSLWLLLIVWVAFAVRVAGLTATGLWYDELQAVTHAVLPLRDLLRSVARWDPHPPVYYVQLHFWMGLGTDDLWVRLNPVFWSTLAVASVYAVSRALFGRRAALAATVLFAVSPFAVWYAQQARMYSLLMCLGLWSLYLVDRLLNPRAVTRQLGTAVALLVVTELFLYSQGAAFLLLASLGCYAVLVLLRLRPSRSALALSRRGVVIQPLSGAAPGAIGTGQIQMTSGEARGHTRVGTRRAFGVVVSTLVVATVLYLPWLRQAAEISVRHTMVPNLYDVVFTLFSLLFGTYEPFPDWLRWLSIALCVAGVILLVVWSKRSRPMVLSFVVLPPLLALLISYFLKPVWLYKSLAYITPFLFMAISLIICELVNPIVAKVVALRVRGDGHEDRFRRRGLIAVAAVVLASALVLQQVTPLTWWDARTTVEFLRSHVRCGQIVYVPGDRFLWGLGWYWIGPRSVSPLTTSYDLASFDCAQDAARPGSNEAVRIVSTPALGEQTIGQFAQGRTVWLVYRGEGVDDPTGYDLPEPDLTWSHNYVTVERRPPK